MPLSASAALSTVTTQPDSPLAPDVELLAKDHPEYVSALARNRRWNYGVNMLDSTTFSVAKAALTETTILPYFVSQLTANALVIGLSPAIAWLGYSLPQLLSAYIVHSTPSRKPFLILIAWLERLAILGLFGMAFAIGRFPDPWVLAGLLSIYCCFWITVGFLIPPYSDFYAKHIPTGRGLFLGVQTLLYGALGVVGAELVRWRLAAAPFPQNLQSVLGIALIMSAPALIGFHLLREVAFPIRNQPQSLSAYLSAIPALLRSTPTLAQLLVIRSVLAIGKLSTPFLALYAIQRFQLDGSIVAAYTAIMLGAQSVSALGWGYLADRLNFRWLWLFSALIGFLQAGLALAAPSAGWFFVVFLLIGLNLGAEATAQPHTLFILCPPAETTRMIGLTNTVLAPIAAAGPLIGGALINRFSYTAALAAAAVVAAAGVAATLFWLTPHLADNRRFS